MRTGKILILATAVVCFGSAVQAQMVPAEYTLKVTPAELDILAKGLGSLPYNDVATFMAKLRTQVMEQQGAAPVPSVNKSQDEVLKQKMEDDKKKILNKEKVDNTGEHK
jgi:hypothetical protein